MPALSALAGAVAEAKANQAIAWYGLPFDRVTARLLRSRLLPCRGSSAGYGFGRRVRLPSVALSARRFGSWSFHRAAFAATAISSLRSGVSCVRRASFIRADAALCSSALILAARAFPPSLPNACACLFFTPSSCILPSRYAIATFRFRSFIFASFPFSELYLHPTLDRLLLP